MSLKPRGERASRREYGLIPPAFDVVKDRELLNLARGRLLSTLISDALLHLSVGHD